MSRRWKDHAALALRSLVRFEQFAAIGLLVVILVTMGMQVVSRYVFGSPISWSEEVARLAMIWLTFVASSFVAAKKQHIAVDLFSPPSDPPAMGLPPQTTASRRAGPWSRVRGWLFSSSLVNTLVLSCCLLLLIG